MRNPLTVTHLFCLCSIFACASCFATQSIAYVTNTHQRLSSQPLTIHAFAGKEIQLDALIQSEGSSNIQTKPFSQVAAPLAMPIEDELSLQSKEAGNGFFHCWTQLDVPEVDRITQFVVTFRQNNHESIAPEKQNAQQAPHLFVRAYPDEILTPLQSIAKEMPLRVDTRWLTLQHLFEEHGIPYDIVDPQLNPWNENAIYFILSDNPPMRKTAILTPKTEPIIISFQTIDTPWPYIVNHNQLQTSTAEIFSPWDFQFKENPGEQQFIVKAVELTLKERNL